MTLIIRFSVFVFQHVYTNMVDLSQIHTVMAAVFPLGLCRYSEIVFSPSGWEKKRIYHLKK